jgi:predicted P-loop ATPase
MLFEQEIQEYCKLSLKVFPVNITQENNHIVKKPAIANWQNLATCNIEEARKLFGSARYNAIGLATGRASGYTAIDVDNKNGVNGHIALEANGIVLPRTWCQSTPTLGFHYLYAYAPGMKNAVALFPGVDIRNDGGFIVLAPSAFPDGRQYLWLEGCEPWGPLLPPPMPLATISASVSVSTKLPEMIKMGERNDTLYKIACSMRAKGHSEEEILAALTVTNRVRCIEPLPQDELVTLVSSAGTKDAGKLSTKKKNQLRFLLDLINKDPALKGLVGHNDFTYDIEFRKAPPWSPLDKAGGMISDNDEIFLKYYLSVTHGIEPSVSLIHEAVIQLAFDNRFHPVKDYLRALKWDQVPRLEEWLITSAGCEDNLYVRTISKKTLVAAVARIENPGCKFDYMLVLEGAGGIRKSMLVEALASESFFSEINITLNEKYVVEKMNGCWILEFSEMAGMKKVDREHIKSFLTIRTDNIRLSYRRNAERFPRQSIFIGTMNPSGSNEWISDDSGEQRRFWPVLCPRNINVEWVKGCRDQLFAEAYHLFKHGEILDINDEKVIELAKIEQEERKERDPWLPIVLKWTSETLMPKFTTTDILMEAIKLEPGRIDKFAQIRIGKILKKMGFKNYREGHNNIRYYFKDEYE